MLVSHIFAFWKKILWFKYNIKTGDLINSIKFDNNKINNLNFFEENIFQDFDSNLFEIYKKNDHASHLTIKGMQIFFKEIIDKVF